jgi:hypothetical protein
MTLLQRIIAVLVIVGAAVLVWGYWHVSTHGTIQISISDVAKKNDRQSYGDVMSADLAFLDASGAVLAQGGVAEPYGTASIRHPEVGDCTGTERQAAFNVEARSAWQRCFETWSRWLMTWVRAVRYATVALPNCRIEKVPVSIAEYRGSWWDWWIPLPHAGGKPYTSFTLSMKVDGARCMPAPSP